MANCKLLYPIKQGNAEENNNEKGSAQKVYHEIERIKRGNSRHKNILKSKPTKHTG